LQIADSLAKWLLLYVTGLPETGQSGQLPSLESPSPSTLEPDAVIVTPYLRSVIRILTASTFTPHSRVLHCPVNRASGTATPLWSPPGHALRIARFSFSMRQPTDNGSSTPNGDGTPKRLGFRCCLVTPFVHLVRRRLKISTPVLWRMAVPEREERSLGRSCRILQT
jgi:hypothetical protein